MTVTHKHIRAAGGIVHADGNIFFTSLDKLNAAVRAALMEVTEVTLSVESEQDLVNRLREAALVVADAAREPWGCILQEIDYAHHHGWPLESQQRLVRMAEAQKKSPPAAPVHGPVASNQDESDRVLALRTLEYANGAKAGWNLAIDADQAGLARIMDSIPEAVRILKTTPPAAQPAPVQEREHITDGSPCWCNPEANYVDPETGVAVIVHKEPQ